MKDKALEILQELVALKDLKASIPVGTWAPGMNAQYDEYNRRKPLAWAAARAALAETQPSADPDSLADQAVPLREQPEAAGCRQTQLALAADGDKFDEVMPPLPAPTGYRYWSVGHSSRWVYAKPGSAGPSAEPLYTAEQMRRYAFVVLLTLGPQGEITPEDIEWAQQAIAEHQRNKRTLGDASQQPRQDVAEASGPDEQSSRAQSGDRGGQLRELIAQLIEVRDAERAVASDMDMDPRDTANWRYAEICDRAIAALRGKPGQLREPDSCVKVK